MTRQTTSANGRRLDENTIAALVDEVDESRLVTSLASMVAMPSVNPFDDNVTESCRELEFADFYQDQMTTLGLQTDRREVVAGPTQCVRADNRSHAQEASTGNA